MNSFCAFFGIRHGRWMNERWPPNQCLDHRFDVARLFFFGPEISPRTTFQITNFDGTCIDPAYISRSITSATGLFAEAAYHRCLWWRVTGWVVKTEAVSGALSGLLWVADPVNYRNLYGQTSNHPFSTLPFGGQLAWAEMWLLPSLQ